MIHLFLKTKHWQLFLLTCGLPFGFQVVVMTMMLSDIEKMQHDPSLFIQYMQLFPILMVLFAWALMGWLWSVAMGLQAFVPQEIHVKVRKFQIFFFIPLVYMLVIFVALSTVFTSLMQTGRPPMEEMGTIVSIIIPLHLLSLFCMFYILYFVAKTFKTVELQRETKFADFTGEFFLLWFFPIGLWILQPKINKMVDTARHGQTV